MPFPSAFTTTANHALLNHLAYADSGHTGYEPTLTKGNLTAASTKISIGGTSTGAVVGAGVTIDVDQTKLTRFSPVHDDMLGEVRSSIAGATVWDVAQINDTGFFLGWLKNNSSDFFQVKIQVPHRRYLGTALDSIHFHYVLGAASNAGETSVFSGSYCWIQPGDTVPANSAWTAFSGAGLTLIPGARSAFYYGLHSIQANIAAPVGEGYGGMLLIKITRGNGTFAGTFGILDCDAHTPVNRLGSANEASE